MYKLGVALTNYASSMEGYSSSKGSRYTSLKSIIERSTISEILEEYNRISINKIWNEPLNQLFQDEIKERVLSEATFVIGTVWRSIENWRLKPYVYIQVGFDEDYSVIDADGEPILESDPVVSSFTIPNVQLAEETQRDILELILNSKPKATVRISESIQVVQLENFTLSTPHSIRELHGDVTVETTVYHMPDLHLLYLILENIWKKTYEPIDLYSIQYNEEIAEIESYNLNRTVIPLPSAEDLANKIKDKSNYSAIWDSIHINALKINSPEAFDKFTIWIWDVCKYLPCSECKYHMLQYILENSPQNTVPSEKGRDNPAFYWTWQFYNAVNKRIKKPEIEYEVALEYYSKKL